MSPAARPIPTPYNVASSQIQQALAHSFRSPTEYPSAPWHAFTAATGPLLPGTVWVVGARPNQGKTSLLAALFSHFFRAGIPALYGISGDGGPTRLRRVLGALHCGLLRRAVLRNAWAEASDTLSADEAFALFCDELRQQEAWADVGMVYDLPVLDRPSVRAAIKFGLANGMRVMVVDHVNRWSPAQGADLTRDLRDAVEDLAATAAAKDFTLILAAQITPWGKEGRNALSEFVCPPLSALKQTQALVEEPHVVVLLHRARRPDVTAADVRAAAIGQKQARDLIEPGILCATIGKHRDDDTVGTTVRLRIDRTGFISDADAVRERQPGEEPGQEADDLPF